jgi:hypothetical protein
VYIAAFAPDKGGSVQSLIQNPPPGAPVPPILPPQDGFLFLDRSKFAVSFAADVEPETAAFMVDSQVPWGVQALSGAVTEPAWRAKPSRYLVFYGRQDDSARCTTIHGEACRLRGGRGQEESCGLRFSAGGCCRSHRARSERRIAEGKEHSRVLRMIPPRPTWS